VFIASPGGLEVERKAFRDEINIYNQTESIPQDILFQAVGWEDTLGAYGRPQSTINKDIRNSDCFILLLWDRWGTPPDDKSSKYSSGTEEEYDVAMECLKSKDYPIKKIILIFKSVDAKRMSDPGIQLQKVLKFRKDIETNKLHLFHTFDTTDSFRLILRKHLATWRRDVEQGDMSPDEPFAEIGQIIEEKSIDLLTTENMKPSDSELIQSAWKLANTGRITEAEVEFAHSTVGNSRPETFIEFGIFLTRIGRLDQATLMLERAANIAEDQNNLLAVSIAYRNLGYVLKTRGVLNEAEHMYRLALQIDKKLDRKEGMASTYGNIGILLNTRGNPENAEKMHRMSLAIYEKIGHDEGMANQYGNLGKLLLDCDDLDGAEKMFLKALKIDKKLDRLVGMASQYGYLGVLNIIKGELKAAEKMIRKALEIDEKLGRLEGMAYQYGNLGIVLYRRGDFNGAEKLYRKALEIDEKLGRLEGMAYQYGNLGIVFELRDDNDGAEKLYQKALEVAVRLGSDSLISWTQSLLDDLYKSISDNEDKASQK